MLKIKILLEGKEGMKGGKGGMDGGGWRWTALKYFLSYWLTDSTRVSTLQCILQPRDSPEFLPCSPHQLLLLLYHLLPWPIPALQSVPCQELWLVSENLEPISPNNDKYWCHMEGFCVVSMDLAVISCLMLSVALISVGCWCLGKAAASVSPGSLLAPSEETHCPTVLNWWLSLVRK